MFKFFSYCQASFVFIVTFWSRSVDWVVDSTEVAKILAVDKYSYFRQQNNFRKLNNCQLQHPKPCKKCCDLLRTVQVNFRLFNTVADLSDNRNVSKVFKYWDFSVVSNKLVKSSPNMRFRQHISIQTAESVLKTCICNCSSVTGTNHLSLSKLFCFICRQLLEHKCRHCETKFDDFDDLKKHMQTRYGEYFCEICLRGCKVRSILMCCELRNKNSLLFWKLTWICQTQIKNFRWLFYIFFNRFFSGEISKVTFFADSALPLQSLISLTKCWTTT